MLQFRDEPVGDAQILRGSTLREMQRIHWLEPNWQAGWGLGFRIERAKDKTYIGHGGGYWATVLSFVCALKTKRPLSCSPTAMTGIQACIQKRFMSG